MSSDPEESRRAQDNQACDTAETFVKLFYDAMDAKRHTMAKFYLGTAVLSWNGNKVQWDNKP